MTATPRRRDRRGRFMGAGDRESPPAPEQPKPSRWPWGDRASNRGDQLSEIHAMLAALLAAQDPKLAKGLKRLISRSDVEAEKWHAIKFAINCGICIAISNGSTAIVNAAYTVQANERAIVGWLDQCKANPIQCLWERKLPPLTWHRSPQGNLAAMLDLIAYAEGTGQSYNLSYTSAAFSSYADHPRRIYTANGISSNAAGRYQFMSPTWDRLRAKLKLSDFSPQSQDAAAIELMQQSGCYSAAVRGDVREFADRCWTQWASFRSSTGNALDDRQNTHTIESLEAKYREFLGSHTGENLISPLPKMTMTSPMLPNRINPKTGALAPHNGTDYACTLGEPVIAPIGGTFWRGNADPNGFGNNWGGIKSGQTEVTIGHTSKLLVTDGETITQGQPIALCGSEGISTGPHLHIEIRVSGELKNPETIFRN